MFMLQKTLLVVTAVLLFPAVPASAVPATGEVRAELQHLFEAKPAASILAVAGRAVALHPDVLLFYRQRNFQPAWLGDSGVSEQGRSLVELLRAAGAEGLCGEDYNLNRIDPLLTPSEEILRHSTFAVSWLANLDILLTDAFLRYASDLAEGRIDPNRAFSGWRARPRQIAPVRLLTYALEKGRVKQVLQGLLPPHPGYFALRAALADYRQRWVGGEWPTIPAGPILRPGTNDPRLPLLRERLQAGGDLKELDRKDLFYDPATAAALKTFQSRHGLKTDGVLGPDTLAALNVPLAERIRQIELNLERWRWLPKSLGARYLMVNIADFSLTLLSDGQSVLSMPVVVGTPYRKTPVFSGRLRYLEFSPYWYVPPTILREDLLPRIRSNPALLGQRHFEIVAGGGNQVIAPDTIDWAKVDPETFPGLLRQQPGPWNPLGRIKFMFPNRYAVYLHDTPDRGLFARDVRSFSSGCIRIARPFELASYLLADGDDPQLRTVLAERLPAVPVRVDLAESMPVHILYWTAWVDDEGRVQFRDDVYWRDLDLEIALEEMPGEDETIAARAERGRQKIGI